MNDRVFLDSSFWIALREDREPDHSRVVDITRKLLTNRVQLVVTEMVLGETHAYFSRSRPRAMQILDDFENNRAIHCETPEPSDRTEAIQLLRRHRDKSYSFCDAISFVVMRRLGIRSAASLDDHFRQIGGFQILC